MIIRIVCQYRAYNFPYRYFYLSTTLPRFTHGMAFDLRLIDCLLTECTFYGGIRWVAILSELATTLSHHTHIYPSIDLPAK